MLQAWEDVKHGVLRGEVKTESGRRVMERRDLGKRD